MTTIEQLTAAIADVETRVKAEELANGYSEKRQELVEESDRLFEQRQAIYRERAKAIREQIKALRSELTDLEDRIW